MFLHVHTHGAHHHHINAHADIRPLRIAIVLTTTVLIVQFIGGVISNSLALLSDTGHVFVDLASLLIAFFGLRIAARRRGEHDVRFTFGLRRIEIIAALTNGFVLLGICIFIIVEAVRRFASPEHVHADEMLWVAVIGFVANGVSAWYLQHSSHITTRSAYLHVLTDLMSSGGVIVGAIILKLTEWVWIDPVVSIAIAVLIIRGAIRIIWQASVILMESAPENINVTELSDAIVALPGVTSVHDVHIWQLGQDDVSATVHVVTAQDNVEMVAVVKQLLLDRYGIHHATIQIETQHMNDSCGA